MKLHTVMGILVSLPCLLDNLSSDPSIHIVCCVLEADQQLVKVVVQPVSPDYNNCFRKLRFSAKSYESKKTFPHAATTAHV